MSVKVQEQSQKSAMNVVIDGVTLTVEQTKRSVIVTRVVARDRKRKIDITSGVSFTLDDHPGAEAFALIRHFHAVADIATARCTCDYRYGFSDHAEHCESIYVAKYDGGCPDDD